VRSAALLPAATQRSARAALNAALRLGSIVLEKGIRGVAIIPLLIQAFGLAGYGKYSLAISVLYVFRPVIFGGVASALIAAIVREPSQEGRLVRRAMLEACGLGLAIWAVLVLVTTVVFPSPSEVPILVGWLGLLLITDAVSLRGASLSVRMREGRLALARTIGSICLLVGVWISFRLGRGLQSVIACNALSGAIEAALIVLLAPRLPGGAPPTFVPARRLHVLGLAAPVMLLTLVEGIGANLDLILVERLSGAANAGAYAGITRVFGALSLVPVAISLSLLPSFAAGGGVEARRCERATALLVALGLPLVCFASLYAPFISVLFGRSFVAPPVLASLLAGRTTLLFVCAPLTTYLIAGGRRTAALHATLLGLGVQVLGCAILIPRFGPEGGAAATVFAELCKLGALLVMLGRSIGLGILKSIPGPLLAGVVSFIVARSLAAGPWARLAAAALCYFPLIELSGISVVSPLRVVVQVIRRARRVANA
jgi:O-antigen/teichoic acid export membrane protein